MRVTEVRADKVREGDVIVSGEGDKPVAVVTEAPYRRLDKIEVPVRFTVIGQRTLTYRPSKKVRVIRNV